MYLWVHVKLGVQSREFVRGATYVPRQMMHDMMKVLCLCARTVVPCLDAHAPCLPFFVCNSSAQEKSVTKSVTNYIYKRNHLKY